jgi:hypothetical protein
MRVPSLGIPALLLAALLPSPSLAQTCNTADRSVLLILDASGSMNARLPNGETRIDVARRAVKGVATQLPGKAQVSLRIYGAQSPPREKNCQDTKVAVPFASAEANGAAITAFIDGSKAQGYTPIALSLQQAAADFPPQAKERVVVLVSDGKETCAGDPVVAAKSLASAGITVHTVGFIVDTAARGQLQSIARLTGGTYFDAPVGPELPETLKSALSACKKVVAAVPVRPQPGKLRTTSATWLASHAVFNAETGQQVGKLDSASREIALPAGIYEVRFGAGSWKGIEVRAGETTTIQPGEIKLDPTTGAVVTDSETGEKHGSMDRMSSAVTLMPGLYDVTMGKTDWKFVRVDAGKQVLLRPVQIKLADGLKWEKARVVTADGGEVFRFDRMTSTATLAPGNYVVEVDGRRIAFDGAEGQVLEVKGQ